MRRGLVAVAVAALMGLSVMAPPQALAQQAPERTAYSYPDYWRANFMSACTGGGAAPEICGCVIKGFEFSWPFWVAEDFDTLSQVAPENRNARQNDLQAAATRIIMVCAENPNIYG